MADEQHTELVRLTQKLLDAIANGDWDAYEQLCDPTLTAFEPEARGNLAEGMGFHRFYFDLGDFSGPRNTTICAPHVRVMGDVAIVSYVRMVQQLDGDRNPVTGTFEETRVWQRQQGKWRHVHFHRSANSYH